MSHSSIIRSAVVIAVLLCLHASADAQNADAKTAFFESKIRPVLVKECYSCHSADAVKTKKLRGGLHLDTREGIRKGGDGGPAVVPGDPKKRLLQGIRKGGDGGPAVVPGDPKRRSARFRFP